MLITPPFYESTPTTFKTAKYIGDVSNQKVYRVEKQDETDNTAIYYVTSTNLKKKCTVMGDDIPAPCGIDKFALDNPSVLMEVKYQGEPDFVEQADRVILSLEFTE